MHFSSNLFVTWEGVDLACRLSATVVTPGACTIHDARSPTTRTTPGLASLEWRALSRRGRKRGMSLLDGSLGAPQFGVSTVKTPRVTMTRDRRLVRSNPVDHWVFTVGKRHTSGHFRGECLRFHLTFRSSCRLVTRLPASVRPTRLYRARTGTSVRTFETRSARLGSIRAGIRSKINARWPAAERRATGPFKVSATGPDRPQHATRTLNETPQRYVAPTAAHPNSSNLLDTLTGDDNW
ncbi:hypothetical protein EV560_10245 [Bosea sp. BK604]|nr:hypothetical protein EV560_10245 [Bosea sp. BK604]